MEKIKTLIADDFGIIRDGLKALLAEEPDIEVVFDAPSGESAYAYIQENPVELVLMDINMPGKGGLWAMEQIRENFPEIGIIALTAWTNHSHIKKAINAGARGYVVKDVRRDELVIAIQKVNAGHKYFSEKVGQVLFDQLEGKSSGAYDKPYELPPDHLTRREVDVLKLVYEELTNLEISQKLHISPRTVDTHRRNLLQKIGARNAVGLVKYGLRHQIL